MPAAYFTPGVLVKIWFLDINPDTLDSVGLEGQGRGSQFVISTRSASTMQSYLGTINLPHSFIHP